MKKMMLFAIAIMGIAFTSNTFGQAADWEIKPAIKKPTATVKKPKQVQPGNSGGTITNQRSSRNLSKIRKPTVKQMQQENNSTYQQIIKNNTTHQNRRKQPNPSRNGSSSRVRKPVSGLTYSKIEYVKSPRKMKLGDIKGERSKQPRRRSPQKRQYKP